VVGGGCCFGRKRLSGKVQRWWKEVGKNATRRSRKSRMVVVEDMLDVDEGIFREYLYRCSVCTHLPQ
jgi:hypothetical protein